MRRPRRFDQVAAQDTAAYASLFHHMRAAGVALPPERLRIMVCVVPLMRSA